MQTHQNPSVNSIIWNLTRGCNFNCSICCMSAIQCDDIQRYKMTSLQNKSELSFQEKRRVLHDVVNLNPEIDFSGGNPVLGSDDLMIIKEATDYLQQNQVSVSLCGCNLNIDILEVLKKVGSVDLTLDSVPPYVDDRPTGYNQLALETIRTCVDEGIETKVATVLRRGTMNIDNLQQIYETICDIGVEKWQLLRFYPVGRAIKRNYLMPSEAEYFHVIEYLKSLTGSTKVVLQHSLRALVEHVKCPAVNEAIGILPNGIVMACPWALDNKMRPIHEKFCLGNISYSSLEDILNSAEATNWKNNSASYCRTLAFTQTSLKDKYGVEGWFNHDIQPLTSWIDSLIPRRPPILNSTIVEA